MNFKPLALCGLLALLPHSVFAANITLAWDASPDPNVTYKLYYGRATGVYTNSVLAGSSTSATVSNLVEGVTWYFAATATDTNGLESDFSGEVSWMIPLPNQPPTLNALSNVTIDEDAGTQVVNLSGISSGSANETQTLSVSAVSSNPGLISNPTVSYASPNATGSISFTPVASASGSATITVTVNDGQSTNNTIARSFVVTVRAVNDRPTLNALSNRTIDANSGSHVVALSGISSGAANENQTLTVTATSSNPALIPNPVVSYTSPNATGSITLTSSTTASGSASITVTVNDGGTTNNTFSRSFTVTVNYVNQAPTISAIPNGITGEGIQFGPIAFTIGDPETAAANLSVSASSSNQSLVPSANIVLAGGGSDRTVTITPVSGQTGSTQISIVVSDGTNSATRTFQLVVQPRPSAPRGLRVVATSTP